MSVVSRAGLRTRRGGRRSRRTVRGRRRLTFCLVEYERMFKDCREVLALSCSAPLRRQMLGKVDMYVIYFSVV